MVFVKTAAEDDLRESEDWLSYSGGGVAPSALPIIFVRQRLGRRILFEGAEWVALNRPA
jgi:hypothetical protein